MGAWEEIGRGSGEGMGGREEERRGNGMGWEEGEERGGVYRAHEIEEATAKGAAGS